MHKASEYKDIFMQFEAILYFFAEQKKLLNFILNTNEAFLILPAFIDFFSFDMGIRKV